MIIHGVLVGLAVMNIVFAFINLFIQKEGARGLVLFPLRLVCCAYVDIEIER
jgi:hypothetical protein